MMDLRSHVNAISPATLALRHARGWGQSWLNPHGPSRTPAGTGLLQRKCACGGGLGLSGECEECKRATLQRRAEKSAPPSVPPIVHEVLRSPGQPLDRGSRSFFEPRFGHDFSRVRVHVDGQAVASARSVNALAYTVGRHLVFGAGQYTPESQMGRQLLAHELTHVLQQGNHDSSYHALSLAESGSKEEEEAERISSSIVGGNGLVHTGRDTIPENAGRALQVSQLNAGRVVQRKIPTGISLKETHALGHANLKNEADKKKYLTYIADVSLMQLMPPGDYTEEQKREECTKESLSEVSNTCPAAPTPFCTGDRCFQVNQYKRPVGDAHTGTEIPDGPDTFVDFHRARFDTSLLDGSGKKQCSVVCHQLYKYRTMPDRQYHELGAFYIIRNFRADKFTPTGSTTPVNITTGEIKKVAAGASVPSKDDFAKNIAPGLVRSGALLDAPPMPQPPPSSSKGEEKK